MKDFGVYCCNTVPRITENNSRTNAERYSLWQASIGKEYESTDRTAAYNLQKNLAKEIMRLRQLDVCKDRIDVNVDPKRILVCLTHINNVTEDMVDQILQERTQNGTFKDIKDFSSRIKGVGPVMSASLEKYLIGFSGNKIRRGKDWLPTMPKCKAAPKSKSTTPEVEKDENMVFVTTSAIMCVDQTAAQVYEILTAASRSLNLRELWADSGCVRGCGGKNHHDAWEKHLAIYGLKPEFLDDEECFKFGDGQIVKSIGKKLYPVFLNGKFRGILDLAIIDGNCPMLLSKTMMTKWGCTLDFGRKEMYLGKFGLVTSFNSRDVPIVNIMDFTKKDVRSQKACIPKEYCLDEDEEFVSDCEMTITPPPGLEILVS